MCENAVNPLAVSQDAFAILSCEEDLEKSAQSWAFLKDRSASSDHPRSCALLNTGMASPPQTRALLHLLEFFVFV
eukprot:773019-Amphidinium_carterae.1